MSGIESELSILESRERVTVVKSKRSEQLLLGELEETTGTPSYYVDDDYPAGPEIQ